MSAGPTSQTKGCPFVSRSFGDPIRVEKYLSSFLLCLRIFNTNASSPPTSSSHRFIETYQTHYSQVIRFFFLQKTAMPYVPPGSDKPQPIPLLQVKQQAATATTTTQQHTQPEASLTIVATPTDDVPTPKASASLSPEQPNPAMASPIPVPQPITTPEDLLASQLAATSLESFASSPPSLCHSVGHPSPSTSSVLSLSEQSSEELSDDHVKVAGEMVGKMDDRGVTVQEQTASKVMIPDVKQHGIEKDPLSLYSEAIYAYTHKLYLRAQHSVTRSQRKKDLAYSQFGSKPTGMEKMARKKAIARQLNG